MSLSYLFDPNKQFQDEAGNNNVDGFLRVYIDGTDDRAITYKDFDGTLNQSDITLDINGRAVVIVDRSKTYRLEVYKRDGGMLWTARPMIPSSEGGGGIDPEDLKDLVIKHGGRTSGTYRPMVGATIDIPKSCEVVSELEDDLYGKITSIFADFRTPVLIKSDIDPETPGVTRDFYYWPTARTGADGNYSFVGNDGVRTEIATVHDDNSVTYTTIEVPTASTSIPSMDGTASAGSSTQWSRGDHVHPTDTSREAAANKTTTVRQNGQADNTKFPTEAAVRTAIDSAVSSAYHASGTKTVAQLTSSLLVSANEGDVYNITDSGTTTSDFIEGAGHPISAGDNVVVCDVGGGVYKFDLLSGFVDLTNYLTKTGDGSDVTATFTAASTRTNVSTGEKLSVLFGKIAKWFGDFKALAFKDKVTDSDISGTISDTHIASASTWNAKQDAISTDTDSSTISDATTIATGYGSNKVHLNTAARLWAYIQDKISSVLGLTSSAYGGKAASLNASAGGPSQPVYFPSSGADLGKPVAIPFSTDPEIAAVGDFLTIQAQGAYYAHKAGNAATADAVAWANVSGKPNASSSVPISDGYVANAGVSPDYARADHIHADNIIVIPALPYTTLGVEVNNKVEYLKAWLKYVWANYQTGVVLQKEVVGVLIPGVNGIAHGQFYGGSGTSEDGYPKHSFFTAFFWGGSHVMYYFGTENGTFYISNGNVDNLTSTSTEYALSANQGRILNGLIAAKANDADVVHKSDNAASATDATYSTKIGSSSSHPAIGSATQPVYVDSDGALQPCTLKGVYFSEFNVDSLSNIIDAFDSGLLVFSKYAGDVYLLLDADSNGATFVCNTTVDGKTYYSTLTVNSSNTWSRTTENIFNNIIVRKHYGANHEASVITTATDISNGYVEYALDFTDMFFGGGNSILFISLPNESTLAYYFTSIEVMTYPYTTGQNSIDICKFTDLTHDDDGNAIGANDEYTWLRTCNSPNYIQRIKGLKLRCYLNTTSGMTWQAGIELKLKLDFNAVRFDKL